MQLPLIFSNHILNMILITLVPTLELRASIPYGLLFAYGPSSWLLVFLVCVITNIILGILLYFFLDFFINILKKINWFNRFWIRKVEKTHKKIKKYVEKYGALGLTIFIGIPIPGSGVYTGVIASKLIDLDFKRFLIACILGVLIAGTAVTLVILNGASILNFFIKTA